MGGNAWADYAAGPGATTYGPNSTAIGINSVAGTSSGSNSSTAVGERASANSGGSVAVGALSTANGNYATALGYEAHTAGTHGMALGSLTSAVSNSVALGFGSQAVESLTVSVGAGAEGLTSSGQPVTRRIVNVSNGTHANDATTVSQLNNAITANNTTGTVALKDAAGTTTKATVYTKDQADTVVKNKVDKLANGAAKTLQVAVHNDDAHIGVAGANGKEALMVSKDATATTTLLRGGTATTALLLADQDKAGANTQSGANLGTTIYDANGVEQTATATDYTNAGGQGVDGIAYFADPKNPPEGAPAGAIGVMRETVNDTPVYKYITDTRLSGVGAGVKDNDAVNVKQLTDALNNVSGSSSAATKANARAIEGNKRAIGGNTQGIANTAAIAGMAPLPAGAANGFTAGISRYNGRQGLAAGFQHRLNANTVFKAAVGTGTSGQPVTTVGLSYTWGGSMPSGTTTPATTGATVHVDMVALQDRLRSTETDLAQARAEAAQAKAEATETKAMLADLLHRMAALEGRQVVSR